MNQAKIHETKSESTNNPGKNHKKMELHPSNRYKKGFRLTEMIGVLAVLAVLAAILIPKVFEAINISRINNAAMSCDTLKTAIGDHFAKFGGLNMDGSTGTGVPMPIPNLAYDQKLLNEQFFNKLFVTKICDEVSGATNTHLQIQPITMRPETADA